MREALAGVGPDDPHPLNLFRVHWHNGADRTGFVDVPEHVVLPPELTGVEARIVVALGDRFPLIGAHKVLAAYGCLVPRLVTGGSTRPVIAPSGPRPATTAAAASRSRACSAAAASPCCPRG